MHSTPHLAEARKAVGLSQQALADQLGVAQQHIARWEVGKVEPKARMAVRLSEALGTTVNTLWPIQPAKPEPEPPIQSAEPAPPPPRESMKARRRREYDERKRRAA